MLVKDSTWSNETTLDQASRPVATGKDTPTLFISID